MNLTSTIGVRPVKHWIRIFRSIQRKLDKAVANDDKTRRDTGKAGILGNLKLPRVECYHSRSLSIFILRHHHFDSEPCAVRTHGLEGGKTPRGVYLSYFYVSRLTFYVNTDFWSLPF